MDAEAAHHARAKFIDRHRKGVRFAASGMVSTGAVLVMLHHEHDRALEVGITELRLGDEQSAGGPVLVSHAPSAPMAIAATITHHLRRNAPR
jgi:hypothetical protein